MAPQSPELLIDGYLSHMFSPRSAEKYHVSLLRRESLQIQWNVILPEKIFYAPPPASVSNQDAWAIDYAIKDRGHVIPQQIWTPRKPSDELRYVHHEQLRPPIFFTLKDGGLGLSLKLAAAGNCMCLRGADQVANVGPSSHAQIRINVSSILTSQVRLIGKYGVLSGMVIDTSNGANKL